MLQVSQPHNILSRLHVSADFDIRYGNCKCVYKKLYSKQ